MSIKIEIKDFPVKLQMTKGRRKIYYIKGEDVKLPTKFLKKRGGGLLSQYEWKEGKLYDNKAKEFLLKNWRTVSKPRFQALSYNKINKRVLVPVLIKLKEYMQDFIPGDLVINTPCMIDCTVYDYPGQGNRDLDNMHIYYKAFLDLIKDMGLIPDDSIRYVTQSGGFRYTPINESQERKLVFSIRQDVRDQVTEHLFYNDGPKTATRGPELSDFHRYKLVQDKDVMTGILYIDDEKKELKFGCGKMKISHANALKALGKVKSFCQNNNVGVYVDNKTYRLHSDRIQQQLLGQGVPVHILTNG